MWQTLCAEFAGKVLRFAKKIFLKFQNGTLAVPNWDEASTDGIDSLLVLRSSVNLLRRGHKLIAQPAYSEQMFRFGGIFFNVAAQADDEIIDRTSVSV